VEKQLHLECVSQLPVIH
jgi:hypothetical protein